MRLHLASLLLSALITPQMALAQQVVTSTGPQAVSVTVYRAPGAGEGAQVNLRFLQGYALITETRTISVPAGDAQIRFEGVAGGIIPVSAIVTGLPGGVLQKNRDAAVLSPAALLDGSLGNRVMLRRTNKATGKVEEQEAILRAGPDQGVVVETKDGIEALKCSGYNEKMVYDKIPNGLSAKPTLSVLTRSNRGLTAQVSLSYLSRNFDWAANYVAEVDAAKGTLSLFAWLTLANGNGESFVQADTNAVAGTVNRDRRAKIMEQAARQPRVTAKCWPMDTTSTHPESQFEREEIIVTGSSMDKMMMAMPAPPMAEAVYAPVAPTARAKMMAKQEELGDLKLYRVPEKVTVNANGQKQVGLLEKKDVPFERIYIASVWAQGDFLTPYPMGQILRLRNTDKKGLGLPLPSGSIAVFEPYRGQQMLVARGPVRDSSIGEKVEINAGVGGQVHWTLRGDPANPRARRTATITNANPWPVKVELVLLSSEGSKITGVGMKLGTKDGQPMWAVTVPANGEASAVVAVQGGEGMPPPARPLPPKKRR